MEIPLLIKIGTIICATLGMYLLGYMHGKENANGK
jgi:hypothetical protein